MKSITILVLVGALFLLFQNILSYKFKSRKIYAIDNLSPRVYVLVFNPILVNHGNVKLINYMNWNNPDVLFQQYIQEVKNFSHGIINYQIIGQSEVNKIPVKLDGYQYTEESYLNCINNSGRCHNQTNDEDIADYSQIISENRICEKVNTGEIDELWMMGGPWFGFYEANMAGPGGFNTNGPVIENTACQKPIHIMGFSYERDYLMMVHDLGHRTEGTMTHIYASVNPSLWLSYLSNIGISPSAGSFGCGDIHHPPNSRNSYVYNDQSVVASNCENWLNYPNLGGSPVNITCSSWNCTELGYYQWWFKHLPHTDGVGEGNLKNNWWSYISNTTVLSNTTSPSPVPTMTTIPYLSPTTPSISNSPTPILTVIPSRTITPTGNVNNPTLTPTTFPTNPSCQIPAKVTNIRLTFPTCTAQ